MINNTSSMVSLWCISNIHNITMLRKMVIKCSMGTKRYPP